MDPFVQELLSMATLTAAEERELALRTREGDQEARRALITSGLRSVALRGVRMGLKGEELRDAVQSGTIGLIQAVDRFDPDQGARLSTYSWLWIATEMIRKKLEEVPLEDVHAAPEEPLPSDSGLLDGLSELERHVLSLRFGFGDSGAFPMSRRAIAELLGVSESRVRTLEGQAVRQVRRRLARVLHVPPQEQNNPQ